MANENQEITKINKGDVFKMAFPGDVVATAEVIDRNGKGVVLEDSAGWKYRTTRAIIARGNLGSILILERIKSGQDDYRRSIDRNIE